MNVFHRFTRESLIRNRSRTLVTIVGIILSVALLTAVTEGAYSGVQFLRRSVEQRVGSFFGYFDNLTEGEASQLTQSHEVTKSTTWQDIGWAAIGSSNDYKPYLHVVSVDADFPLARRREPHVRAHAGKGGGDSPARPPAHKRRRVHPRRRDDHA